MEPTEATIIVQLTRPDVSTDQSMVDLDGREYAIFLETGIENALEDHGIDASVKVYYTARDGHSNPPTIIASSKAESSDIRAMIDRVRSESWQAFYTPITPLNEQG